MADLQDKFYNNSSKKNKNNSSQTLTLTLPDHILIEEILARLPVKSLIRFKSVCKYWLFIISSRKFEKFHLKFSYLRRQFLILPYDDEIWRKKGFFFLLSYNECSTVKDLVSLGSGGIEEFPIIAGSCNGLLCLIDKEEYAGKFVVWNPATDDYREITNPNNIPDVIAYGFGYDSLNDDYKIAASFGTRTGKFRGFYVFSLRNGEWKSIVGKFDRHVLPIAVRLDSEALLIGDTLYWPPRLAQRFGQDLIIAKHIVGFDLVSEKFKEISWPNDSCQYYQVDLYQFKGNLTYGGRENSCSEVWDFWMLKEVDKTDTWEKLFTVDLTNVLFYRFSKTDKCLVRHFEHLKLVDPCKEALEQVCGNKKYSHRAITDEYAESLVSPFATTKIDKEDENFETAIRPIMENINRKILLNKRVPVSQIQINKSNYEDKDGYDGCESDIEDDDGFESGFEDEDDDDDDDDGCESDLEDDGDGSRRDLEDDGKVDKYWISSDDDDKDSDYFKYATSNDDDDDDDDDDDGGGGDDDDDDDD